MKELQKVIDIFFEAQKTFSLRETSIIKDIEGLISYFDNHIKFPVPCSNRGNLWDEIIDRKEELSSMLNNLKKQISELEKEFQKEEITEDDFYIEIIPHGEYTEKVKSHSIESAKDEWKVVINIKGQYKKISYWFFGKEFINETGCEKDFLVFKGNTYGMSGRHGFGFSFWIHFCKQETAQLIAKE